MRQTPEKVGHLSSAEILKSLQEQGFRIEETHDGWVVLGDEGTAGLHASSIDKSTGRSYANQLQQLKKLGWTPPQELKRARRQLKRETREERNRRLKEAGPYKCEDCGVEFPYPQNLGRHQSASRHGKYKELPLVIPSKAPKPAKVKKEEVQAVQLLKKLDKLDNAMKALEEERLQVIKELIGLVEPMSNENAELRRKQDRLQDIMGKAIDNL